MGVQANGPFKYAAHFAGPIWWMAPLMIPIEIVSQLARPLSLTIRLFANMYAGEQVTGVFLKLTLLLVQALFGPARVCFHAAGIYFYAFDHDVRGGSGSARPIIPALCRSFSVSPAARG